MAVACIAFLAFWFRDGLAEQRNCPGLSFIRSVVRPRSLISASPVSIARGSCVNEAQQMMVDTDRRSKYDSHGGIFTGRECENLGMA